MTRQLALAALAIALLPALAGAEAVQPTTLERACAKAPVIAIATIKQHELETLKDGETREIDMFSLRVDYEIAQLIHVEGDLPIKNGQTIGLVSQNNSCLRYKTVATRRGDTITLVHSGGKPQTRSLKDIRKDHGKRVVLFLQHRKEATAAGVAKSIWSHFGWFISGKTATEKLSAQIKAELKKRLAKAAAKTDKAN